MWQDNGDELLPIVDEQGNILGSINRREAHSGGKVLHPVVHLHLFNSKGELYLQKRPAWKDIQPDKWDTACGGHIGFGESVELALKREVKEELGVENFVPERIGQYVFDGDVERELIYVHKTIYDGAINIGKDELADGRFWYQSKILTNIGKGVFTPNFESEYVRFFG